MCPAWRRIINRFCYVPKIWQFFRDSTGFYKITRTKIIDSLSVTEHFDTSLEMSFQSDHLRRRWTSDSEQHLKLLLLDDSVKTARISSWNHTSRDNFTLFRILLAPRISFRSLCPIVTWSNVYLSFFFYLFTLFCFV